MASIYLSIFSRHATRVPVSSGMTQFARTTLRNAAGVQSTVVRQAARPRGMGWGIAGAVTLGMGISAFSSRNNIYCDSTKSGSPTPAPPPKGVPANDGFPDAPTSGINLYELSFGTVCGLCAGVFVKKGAKFLAFSLGGVFVLLQYFGSLSVLKVDWNKAGRRFERLFYTTDDKGVRHAPNVYSLWTWMVDFLTADFQPRASFIAGFALGIRVG